MMRKLTLTLALAALLVALSCGAGLADGTVVSLNKATAEQLANIPDAKIPPALAKAIVDYREANGPFTTPESLSKVPGMTNDYLEMLNPVLKDGDVVHDPDAEAALAPSKC
ncbi:MAG: ComEA family DNA-binding protein [Thermodesulfobacteriota bacterium]